ncbi:hypothetical protein NHX12_001307 [Muraenolepis orangiensis]|uniref:E3 SUMO-protein ligase NSE2 n=1 Tax=Muraenolepis orangiensis TaxID=630683 RepID=A0A9Q0IH35_9TELE|nr:hypothetical protein NHX12_001307 [Muraenolepis orangiensis]
MSINTVHTALSSVTSCQPDLGTSMDIVTDVAMDLVEDQEVEPGVGLAVLHRVILDCARLDREINMFSDIVEQLTSEVGQQPPEAQFSLSERVKQQFEERKASLSEAELLKHPKVVAFQESVHIPLPQDEAAESLQEEVDEDIAVMQSQVNFTCPLTQVNMENPVRNRVCNHHYDEAAILSMVKARHKQQRKCRCPVVGCVNQDVTQAHLVPDHLLRRRIQKLGSNKV